MDYTFPAFLFMCGVVLCGLFWWHSLKRHKLTIELLERIHTKQLLENAESLQRVAAEAKLLKEQLVRVQSIAPEKIDKFISEVGSILINHQHHLEKLACEIDKEISSSKSQGREHTLALIEEKERLIADHNLTQQCSEQITQYSYISVLVYSIMAGVGKSFAEEWNGKLKNFLDWKG